MRKIVVLDACVLYSAPLRDLLLHLAQQKLYKPRWSDRINDEWIRNVLKKRPDLNERSFDRLRFMMNDTFPRANVKGFEPLSKGLYLPDADDIHVLAAAIKSFVSVAKLILLVYLNQNRLYGKNHYFRLCINCFSLDL